MEAIQIIPLVLAAGFTANILAAPAPKPPPGPTDVNVVNTPNVTVSNPQTSVTVDNTSPIPVSVQGCSAADYEFVGNSDDPVITYALGSQSQACRNKFGSSARWATTKEVIEAYDSGTVTMYPQPSTFWVARPIQTITNGASGLFFDPYVRNQAAALKCFSVSNDGGFPVTDCYAVNGVMYAACSVPK